MQHEFLQWLHNAAEDCLATSTNCVAKNPWQQLQPAAMLIQCNHEIFCASSTTLLQARVGEM
jgi:hypothetical protein